MTDSRFGKVATLFFIAGLFYIGHGLHSAGTVPGPTLATPVFAGGVAVANDEQEIVFTSNENGKKIYMWQYYSSKPPKYLGHADAVLKK